MGSQLLDAGIDTGMHWLGRLICRLFDVHSTSCRGRLDHTVRGGKTVSVRRDRRG